MNTDFLILMGLTIGVAVFSACMGLLEQKREMDKERQNKNES